MLKIYLRSLINSLKYAGVFLGVCTIGGAALYVIAAMFFAIGGGSTFILLGVPTIVTFIFSIYSRQEYKDIAKDYRENSISRQLHIGQDLKRIFRSKEFWIEFFVACHYIVVLCIIGGIIIFHNVLEGILIVIGCAVLHIILNAASWLLVHREYLKYKVE